MTDKTNEYPLMLYLGGDVTAANIIVEDAEGEAIAKEGGFVRLGTKADNGGQGGDKPMTATELKEKLKELDVEFAGNASRDVLQGLYDDALAKKAAEDEKGGNGGQGGQQ